MKKINFTLFILIALAVNVFAQIPNNGFENWTNMGSYYNPVSWACLNDETASAGVFTCERGTPGDPGNYFLKLTSKPVGPEIVLLQYLAEPLTRLLWWLHRVLLIANAPIV